MKKLIALIAVLTFFAGVIVSQTVIERRVLDSSGIPTGIGYGTSMPTVANDGRPPFDGEIFSRRVTGTDPRPQMYSSNYGDWIDVPTAKYNVIHEDFTFVSGQVFEEDLTAAVVTDGAENVILLPGSSLGVIAYRLEAGDGPGLAATLDPFSALGFMTLTTMADAAINEGVELVFGAWGPDLQGAHFDEDLGNSMVCEIDMAITDISDVDDVWFGWVVKEAYDNPPASISFDTAALFVISDAAGDLDIETELNGGGTSNDDTGVTWADGESHILTVRANADTVAFTLDGNAVTQTNATLDMDDTDQAVCVYGHTLAAASDPGVVIDYVEIRVEQ